MLRMPEKPVISNTSPLVCLWGLDLLYLLRELYTEVWIPEEVAKEFSATALTDRQAALDNSPWIRTVRLRRSPSKPSISGIDAGEAAVLALAEEYPPQIILCSPYDEPNAHWIYDTQTGEAIRQPGRRDAGYWYKTQRTGSEQLSLFREEKWDDLHRCQ